MSKASASPSRWMIAAAGTALQLCLGTIYAWSYFQAPLVEAYGWSHTQVAGVFSVAICCLGLAAAWGGTHLARWGPRPLAVTGGVLFGGGYLLAALALHWKSLPWLYAGYGLLGGAGLGLGYVTPVATVAKWFPDKKGLVTGLVVMGFGLGALLMSKLLAPALMTVTRGNLVAVFFSLGLLFLPVTVAFGWMLRNPSVGHVSLMGAREVPAPSNHAIGSLRERNRGGWFNRQFIVMWIAFFCNIVAGIAIIGFQSPLFQDLLRRAQAPLAPAQFASYGATLIAVSSLFNGIGRFFWGGLSDRIGRARTFRILLGTQAGVFLILSQVTQPWLFAVGVCYILLCYGGGFGAMPSFVLEVFGERRMPTVYGSILTAWSAAGLVGPQIVAWLKDHDPQLAATRSFLIGAAFLVVGTALSFTLRDPPMDEGGASHEE